MNKETLKLITQGMGTCLRYQTPGLDKDCQGCALTSYGLDCQNNPVDEKREHHVINAAIFLFIVFLVGCEMAQLPPDLPAPITIEMRVQAFQDSLNRIKNRDIGANFIPELQSKIDDSIFEKTLLKIDNRIFNCYFPYEHEEVTADIVFSHVRVESNGILILGIHANFKRINDDWFISGAVWQDESFYVRIGQVYEPGSPPPIIIE